MKNAIVKRAIGMACLLAVHTVQAQGTVFSSNLADTPTGGFTVAKNSLIAQEFGWEGAGVNGVIGTPDCILNSIQLQMDMASGNPNGCTVSIYTIGFSGPGNAWELSRAIQTPTVKGFIPIRRQALRFLRRPDIL